MRLALIALLLAGCRSLLGFDDVSGLDGSVGSHDGPRDGTPTGLDVDGDGIDDGLDNCVGTPNADQADEDGDGTGDGCDPCPHLNGPQDDLDSDHDGIGDGCDPNPNTPGDVLVRFDGFNSGGLPTGYAVIGGSANDYQVASGALRLATTSVPHALLVNAGGPNAWIDIVFDRAGTGTGAELGLLIDGNDALSQAFLCTIRPAVPEQAAEQLSNGSRTSLLSLGGAGPTSGRFVAGGRATQLHCDWPSTGTAVANPTITRSNHPGVGILVTSMQVAIHSIAIYRTP